MTYKTEHNGRRRFLRNSSAVGASLLLPFASVPQASAQQKFPFGTGQLRILSDGNLQLPGSLVFPETIDEQALETLLAGYDMNPEQLTPDCNLTLWQTEERTILFDVGAGANFMPSAGKLPDSLMEAGIDPADITDVVFTHAHPDHLWGLLDDFDDLFCPNANYHMAANEWDYWRADDTLDNTPDERKAFVAGALNRFPAIEERINLFRPGQEILPDVEAVDTSGHTPGHTSFALHAGRESIMIIGDAITNVAVSFAQPDWPTRSDQDPDKGRATRVRLLDRLAQDKTAMVGYHLPHPGLGSVERKENHYQFAV